MVFRTRDAGPGAQYVRAEDRETCENDPYVPQAQPTRGWRSIVGPVRLGGRGAREAAAAAARNGVGELPEECVQAPAVGSQGHPTLTALGRLSRETEPMACAQRYLYKEIYFKDLIHPIVEAGRSKPAGWPAVWRPRVELMSQLQSRDR